MNITDLFKNHQPSQAKIMRPYIIVEAGVNHEGEMDLAKRLINEAQEDGAAAVRQFASIILKKEK